MYWFDSFIYFLKDKAVKTAYIFEIVSVIIIVILMVFKLF